MEKDCILCKQGEISGLVTDTKAQVVSFVSCAAAAFAAASALAFPVEIKLLSLVCAVGLDHVSKAGMIMQMRELWFTKGFTKTVVAKTKLLWQFLSYKHHH